MEERMSHLLCMEWWSLWVLQKQCCSLSSAHFWLADEAQLRQSCLTPPDIQIFTWIFTSDYIVPMHSFVSKHWYISIPSTSNLRPAWSCCWLENSQGLVSLNTCLESRFHDKRANITKLELECIKISLMTVKAPVFGHLYDILKFEFSHQIGWEQCKIHALILWTPYQYDLWYLLVETALHFVTQIDTFNSPLHTL